MNFPSVTLCNDKGLDTGEYVRNVFNNLAFVGDKGSKLKEEFKAILDDLTVDMDYKHVTYDGMFQKFMENWMRYVISSTVFSVEVHNIIQIFFPVLISN